MIKKERWFILLDTRIKSDKLRDFAINVGIKVGLSSVDAFSLADSLVFANLRGIDSHGIIRLPFYLKRLETKGQKGGEKQVGR